MNHAKKFYLVDASQLKRISDEQPNIESTPSQNARQKPFAKRELDSLDRGLLDIINNNSLTQDEKVDEYSKALTQYTTMKHQYNTAPQTTTDSKTTPPKDDSYNPFLGIIKTYQNKAKKLFEILNSTGSLQVSQKGEAVIDNKTLSGSNITDLLNAAVNPKAKMRESVSGFNDFVDLLEKVNIPHTLITKEALSSPSIQASPIDSPSKTERLAETKKRKWESHDKKKPWR